VPFNLGVWELLIIMLVVLLIFGAKRLPEIGQSMGKGIREFKKSIKDVRQDLEEGTDDVPTARRLDAPPTDTDRREGEPKKLSE
jgi:sec-independent protein translocase protein TatA